MCAIFFQLGKLGVLEIHQIGELLSESLLRKTLRIETADFGFDWGWVAFKSLHRCHYGFGRLFFKKNARGFTVLQSANGFECAAFAKVDDGGAAGLGLERGEANIFFGGKDKRLGLLQMRF